VLSDFAKLVAGILIVFVTYLALSPVYRDSMREVFERACAADSREITLGEAGVYALKGITGDVRRYGYESQSHFLNHLSVAVQVSSIRNRRFMSAIDDGPYIVTVYARMLSSRTDHTHLKMLVGVSSCGTVHDTITIPVTYKNPVLWREYQTALKETRARQHLEALENFQNGEIE